MIKLFVFPPDLSEYHEVLYRSLQAEEHYNAVGKITLVVEATDYNIEHLQKDAFLYWTESEQAFWIRRVSPSTKDNTITVNGYTTNALLNKRVFSVLTEADSTLYFAPKDHTGLLTSDGADFILGSVENSVESQIYANIENNLRGLSNIEFAPIKNLDRAYNGGLEHGQILDEVIQYLNLTPFGQRMKFEHRNQKHVFEIYEGRDLTEGSKAVRFSEEQGTAKNLVIDIDESLFKNVCYVQGKKNDENESIVTVVAGNAEGDDRFEFWLDQEFTQEQDETDDAFLERLETEGLKEIAKREPVTNFSVVIDSSELGKAYKLGDKVTCVSKRFGVKFNSRITGVKFVQDPNIKTVSLVLGNPTIDIIREIKLWR